MVSFDQAFFIAAGESILSDSIYLAQSPNFVKLHGVNVHGDVRATRLAKIEPFLQAFLQQVRDYGYKVA